MKAGIVFRPGSLWIGAHWSPYNRRLCVNVLPTITVWFTFEGGKTPADSRAENTVPYVAQQLVDAKDAHVEYERVRGVDPDWPTWYARYLLGRSYERSFKPKMRKDP